ncbi:hypothetical protein BJ508DRAFT_323944 [Ascobolus immersus RN42]|uniref:Uncharacterized protein n=1 Tax=Ascobolus immersus RN42 TaxID=1160509 RepID=A0A3N4IGY9_ASCIM|nr:hypothetical protein BJ508DRAFT_323944 [Ascobolus immersus RN42]
MKLPVAFMSFNEPSDDPSRSRPVQGLGAILFQFSLPSSTPPASVVSPLSPAQQVLGLLNGAPSSANSDPTFTSSTIHLSQPSVSSASPSIVASLGPENQCTPLGLKICAFKSSLVNQFSHFRNTYASYSYSFSPRHHYILTALSQLLTVLILFTLLVFAFSAVANHFSRSSSASKYGYNKPHKRMFSLRNIKFFPGSQWTSKHLFIAVLCIGLTYWLYLDFHSVGPAYSHDFSDDRTVNGWTAKIPGKSNNPYEVAAEGKAHESVVKRAREVTW